MSHFPRDCFSEVELYRPDRRPVEVDLSDNTNLWGPHPAAVDALKNARETTLSRYPDVQADRLRLAAAETFQVEPGCVATGCGSDDLLDAVFRVASEPGGRVAYSEPTFSMVPIFARMNGLVPAPLGPAALEDPSAFLEIDPSLIYLCSPNNPTGRVLGQGFLEGLLELLQPGGPVVVLDEAYADFTGESRIHVAAESSRLIVLRTLSKAHGLAGLRVGLAFGPPDVIQEVAKSRGPYKVTGPSELAATAALEDRQGWVSEIVGRVTKNRDRLAAELARRGWSLEPSSANFLLLRLEARGLGASALTAELRNEGVGVRPFPDLRGMGDALRVTVGPWEMMERFLGALDRAEERISRGGTADGPSTTSSGAEP